MKQHRGGKIRGGQLSRSTSVQFRSGCSAALGPGHRDARRSLYWRSGRDFPPDALRGQAADTRVLPRCSKKSRRVRPAPPVYDSDRLVDTLKYKGGFRPAPIAPSNRPAAAFCFFVAKFEGGSVPVIARKMRRHSMTLSARASSDCGKVRPSAFAAFRLITNSNLWAARSGDRPVWRP